MSPTARNAVERMAAVLVTPPIGAAAPPGIDSAAFGMALIEDSCDVIADLEFVTPAVAVAATVHDLSVAELAWPGTAVLRLDRPGGPVRQTLRHLGALGARQGAVLAADAPDIPLLLIGKLFRALGGASRRADVAVCPADGGGLVAIAAWLPLANWVAAAVNAASPETLELDIPDVVARLRQAAPRRNAVAAVPGWHRLRTPADLSHLDPGLEGWPATRSVLRPRR